MPGFCVVMPRIPREGDAPDFACGGMGKAAWGRGFSAWVLCRGWCGDLVWWSEKLFTCLWPKCVDVMRFPVVE